MGARIDITDPHNNNRGTLNAAWLLADVDKLVGVSLNASGRIVRGTAGQSLGIGLVCLDTEYPAGQRVDVLVDAEVLWSGSGNPWVAGTRYYIATNGDVNTTPSRYLAGWTVEADRFCVHFMDLGAIPA